MSVYTELVRIENAVESCIEAIIKKGVTISSHPHIDELPDLIAQIETGGTSEIKLATGTFTGNAATYVDVTFDEALSSVPDFIAWWETTTDYYSSTRMKFAVGVRTAPFLVNGTSGTSYYQYYVRGSTSNTGGTVAYSITNTSTGTSYGGIRRATTTGFRAYYTNTSSYLRGDYQYVAICF